MKILPPLSKNIVRRVDYNGLDLKIHESAAEKLFSHFFSV